MVTINVQLYYISNKIDLNIAICRIRIPNTQNNLSIVFISDSPLNPIKEFAQLCGRLLGPKYEYISGISSIMAVTGAVIVYWVLMSNFLMNTGDLIVRELKYNVV